MIINITRDYPQQEGSIELLPYCDTEKYQEFYLPDEFLDTEIITNFMQTNIDLHKAYWASNQSQMIKDKFGNEIETRAEFYDRQSEVAKTVYEKLQKYFFWCELAPDGEIRNAKGNIAGSGPGLEHRAVVWQRHLLINSFTKGRNQIQSIFLKPEKCFEIGFGKGQKLSVSVLTKKPVKSYGQVRPDWFYVEGRTKLTSALKAQKRSIPIIDKPIGDVVNNSNVDRLYSV